MSRKYGRKRKKDICRLQFGWIAAAMISIVVIIVCGEKLIALSNNFKSPESDSNNSFVSDKKTGNNTAGTSLSGGTKEPTQGAGKPTDGIIKPTSEPTKEIEPTKEPEPTKESEPTKEPEPTSDELEDDKKLVAFTFDDGPYPPVTQRILDVLEENGARATFFVMGNRMGTYPDVVKSAYELGCQIANHSYSHENLTKISKEKIIYEVEHSNDCINEVVEVGDVMLRPPYGSHNDLVDQTVKVPMIAWSVDSLDWKSRNKDAIVKEVLEHIQDGDIVLMHDLYSTTADAVEYLVPELIKQGYEFVTVAELFERKGIELETGKLYRNARK